EAADLPVVLGAAELDRLGGQGPGVVHPGDVEVGMALDVEMLLGPHQVLLAMVDDAGGVQREGLPAGVDLAAFDPLALEGIRGGVLQHEHAVVEGVVSAGHIDGGLLVRRGRVVDVPGIVDAVDLRGPDQVRLGAVLVAAPDGHLLGTLQIVEMRGAAQDDPVVLGVGGGEEVLVPMSQHAGVRALQHQGIHGRCIVACHAVPSSEMVWGPKLRPLCTANGKRCKLVRSEERRVGSVTGVQTCALPISRRRMIRSYSGWEAVKKYSSPCRSTQGSARCSTRGFMVGASLRVMPFLRRKWSGARSSGRCAPPTVNDVNWCCRDSRALRLPPRPSDRAPGPSLPKNLPDLA